MQSPGLVSKREISSNLANKKRRWIFYDDMDDDMDDDDDNNDDTNDEQIAKDKRGQSCGLRHQHFDWERRHLALVSAEVFI